MDQDTLDEDMRFTVCLYGIALDRADIVPLMGEVEAFLCAIEQHPTHFSVRAPGFGKNPLQYKRAFKRLHKANPEELESVGLYALMEEWITLWDSIAFSGVLPGDAYFDLGISLGTVADPEQRVMRFVERWMERMRPAYGIGFYRPLDLGPDFYGIGLSAGYSLKFSAADRAESHAVNRWSDGMEQAVYDHGILRDVYPYSLLTARHLEREAVDGVCLGDWIQSEPWRGELSACANGYTLWTVAGEHLATVRQTLAAAGALYVLARENHLCVNAGPA